MGSSRANLAQAWMLGLRVLIESDPSSSDECLCVKKNTGCTPEQKSNLQSLPGSD